MLPFSWADISRGQTSLRLRARAQRGTGRTTAPGRAVTSAGEKRLLPWAMAWPCRAALASSRRLGEGCPRAGRCKVGSRGNFSPCGATPGPTVHLENTPTVPTSPCTSRQGVCLLPAHRAGHSSPGPARSHCSPSPAPPPPQPCCYPDGWWALHHAAQGWAPALNCSST